MPVSEKMKDLIDKIKEEKIVVNLCQEKVPACAYLYLAKALEFIRKLERKAFSIKIQKMKLLWPAWPHTKS